MLLLLLLGYSSVTHLKPARYGDLGTVDFVQYWTAGQLLARGENPYDAALLLTRQQELGRHDPVPLRMWNPPWILVLMFPILILPFFDAALAWIATNLVIVLLCATILWFFFGGRRGIGLVLAWLTAVFFFPFLLTWGVGQTSCLPLLGVVLFLFSVPLRRRWLMAIALLLLACKPQMVYLFGLAALLWLLRQRLWQVLGIAGGLFSGMAVVLWLFRSSWLADYGDALRQPPTYWATPTIGGALRVYLGMDSAALQFLAPALGMVALLIYLIGKPDLEWRRCISPLILISSITAPFGWSYDQVILLIPVTECLVAVTQGAHLTASARWLTLGLIYFFSASLLVMNILGVDEAHRLWGVLLIVAAFWVSREKRIEPSFQEES